VLTVAVVSFALLSVTAFCLKNKRLHLFEILAIWLAVMAVNSPMYSYFLVNKHWISVSDSKELAVIRIVYTEVLNPLFFAWVLDEVSGRSRSIVRAAYYAAAIGVIYLGSWILHNWGVFRFSPIGWWMYAPAKMIVVIAALCSASLIRYLMRKDGAGHDSISRN